MEARDHTSPDEWIEARRIVGAEIGQYAYRYTEDIRKDRDYWKDTATASHDAIHQHIENHRGECPECKIVGGGLLWADRIICHHCSNAPWGKDGES
jgi:hypothetical protein